MEIVLVANEKGGSGKSATVHTLANALTGLGYRVLAVDFDPSGNLSRAILPDFPQWVLYDVFTGACKLDQAIYHTDICDVLPTIKELELDIAPADAFLLQSKNSKSLTQLANRLAGRTGAEVILRNLLRNEQHDLASRYDFILIDSAPSDNILVTNAIVAADSIIIPCEPSQPGLDGVWMFISSVTTARRSYIHAKAEIDGIVMTKYTEDGSNFKESIQSIRDAAAQNNIYLYNTVMRHSNNVSHAMGHCRPILSYLDSFLGSGHGPVDALNLALEFLSARGLEPKKEFPGVQRSEDGTLFYSKPKKEAK